MDDHPQICAKCPLITMYRKDYINHPKFVRETIIPPKQKDKTLITGYLGTDLQVRGKRQNTKIWPEITLTNEEYEQFLRRLACCKKEVYKLYYGCKDVDLDYIQCTLNSLMKTVYQCGYSPKGYWPLKDAQRFAKLLLGDTNFKYHETIYRTYYNRIEELESFRDVMQGHMIQRQHDHDELRNELRLYSKSAATTYYMDLCIPSIVSSKKPKNQTEPGPIDQYTLRRI